MKLFISRKFMVNNECRFGLCRCVLSVLNRLFSVIFLCGINWCDGGSSYRKVSVVSKFSMLVKFMVVC